MGKRWKYAGDVNLRYGGIYYRRVDAYSIECVEIVDLSQGGAPDNLFAIQIGSIPLDDAEGMARALPIIGVSPEDATDVDRVVAWGAYWGFGGQDERYVRIGPKEDARAFAPANENPDYVLRGNAKLRNFVRREFLQG